MLSTMVDDDVAMMDVERGTYYGLEAVAARIWTLTEQPMAVGALCDQLVTEYRVSPERCEQEVLTFLRDLLHREVLQICSGEVWPQSAHKRDE